jgi:hypothetical protein
MRRPDADEFGYGITRRLTPPLRFGTIVGCGQTDCPQRCRYQPGEGARTTVLSRLLVGDEEIDNPTPLHETVWTRPFGSSMTAATARFGVPHGPVLPFGGSGLALLFGSPGARRPCRWKGSRVAAALITVEATGLGMAKG